jgi:hypothetical protein
VLDIGTSLTMVIAETTGSNSIYYLHGLGLVAQADGTNVEYLAKDGLGSVRQVLNYSGGVIMSQTFDSYGNLYNRSGTNESGLGWGGEQADSNGLVCLNPSGASVMTGLPLELADTGLGPRSCPSLSTTQPLTKSWLFTVSPKRYSPVSPIARSTLKAIARRLDIQHCADRLHFL